MRKSIFIVKKYRDRIWQGGDDNLNGFLYIIHEKKSPLSSFGFMTQISVEFR